MKELAQSFVEAKDIARIQAKPFMFVLAVLAIVYLASSLYEPGWITYAASVPPSLVITLTALARVNDMGPEAMRGKDHLRRFGLIFSGTGAVMVLFWPATDTFPISWRLVVLLWGVACTWITTPGMPPWQDYITGRHKTRGYSHFDNFAPGWRGRKTDQ